MWFGSKKLPRDPCKHNPDILGNRKTIQDAIDLCDHIHYAAPNI